MVDNGIVVESIVLFLIYDGLLEILVVVLVGVLYDFFVVGFEGLFIGLLKQVFFDGGKVVWYLLMKGL